MRNRASTLPLALAACLTQSHLGAASPPDDRVFVGGCADVEQYADITDLQPSSQQLFAAMVGSVCGQVNFLTGEWFGGHCTYPCASPGDWCDLLRQGVLAQSSDACNACATAWPPTGAMDAVLACAGDPNNTAP